MKTYLIHMRTAPQESSLGLEMQELAFALSAFAQPVSLLFSGDGVLQLIAQPTDALYKDFTKAYAALDLFEIGSVYVDRQSAHKYNVLDKITIAVEFVDDIQSLIDNHDIVI